jgi:hypothetical protein
VTSPDSPEGIDTVRPLDGVREQEISVPVKPLVFIFFVYYSPVGVEAFRHF